MKTLFVLLFVVLGSAGNAPAQPLWLQRLPQGGGSPDCAPPDDSSRVRLMAQAAPITRGDKISTVTAAVTETSAVKTNSPAVAGEPGTNQPAAIQDGDFVGFDKLAGFSLPLPYELEYATNAPVADAQINALIPAHLKAASGKIIRVDGYMTPLDYDKGKVSNFILARSPSSCCFGDMPQIHEMIQVHVKGPPVLSRSYLPVQVRGVLQVGAQRSDGALTSVYRLEAGSVNEVSN